MNKLIPVIFLTLLPLAVDASDTRNRKKQTFTPNMHKQAMLKGIKSLKQIKQQNDDITPEERAALKAQIKQAKEIISTLEKIEKNNPKG